MRTDRIIVLTHTSHTAAVKPAHLDVALSGQDLGNRNGLDELHVTWNNNARLWSF